MTVCYNNEPLFDVSSAMTISDDGTKKIQFMKENLDSIRNGTFSGTFAKFRKWKKCIYKFHNDNFNACYQAEIICDEAAKLLISYKQPNDRFVETLRSLFESPFKDNLVFQHGKRLADIPEVVRDYRDLLTRKRKIILNKLLRSGVITSDESVLAAEKMENPHSPSDYPLSILERRVLFPSINEDKIGELPIEPDITPVMMANLIPWVLDENLHKVWFIGGSGKDNTRQISDFEVTHYGFYLFKRAYADNVSYWARIIMNLIVKHREGEYLTNTTMIKRLVIALGHLRVTLGGKVTQLLIDMSTDSMYESIWDDIKTQLSLFNRESIRKCCQVGSERTRVRLAKIQMLLAHNNNLFIKNLPLDQKIEYLLSRYTELCKQ